MNKKGDKTANKVVSTLKKDGGMTITDIVKKTKLNRSAVRTALAKLDGARRVRIKKIGMAKVYSLNGGRKWKI